MQTKEYRVEREVSVILEEVAPLLDNLEHTVPP
jgi:hypothetical protein